MTKISTLLNIVLSISLLLSCSNNKIDSQFSVEENIYYQTPPFESTTVQEGILISLSGIPDDVTSIFIEINNWGERTYTYKAGDYPEHRDMITSSYAIIEGSRLEQIRQTKELIFPFVKTGEKYNVSVMYIKPNINCTSAPFSQIIAKNGIYLEKEIKLILNENKTGVILSDEPIFSSFVEYSEYAYSFSFSLFNDEMASTMCSISIENNKKELSWDFEPLISEQIKTSRDMEKNRDQEIAYYKSGDYTAFINLKINLIYNNIEWQNYLVKSPGFDYFIN